MEPVGNVAIYIRVATKEQASLDFQTKKVLRFAAEKGVKNPVCYTDSGYSGFDMDRPGFSRLQADIFAGKVQTIIMLDETRISRDYMITSEWMEGAKKLSVRLLFYHRQDNSYREELEKVIMEALRKRREQSRKSFAKKQRNLLVTT